MPAADLLVTATYQRLIGTIPPFMRQDPTIQAIFYARAQEADRLAAAVETVRAELFPQTADALLVAWEFAVAILVEPAGVTVADRQRIVLAFLRALSTDPTGAHWVAVLQFITGGGLSYITHIGGDGGTPDANVVRVILPYPSDSVWFTIVSRLLRQLTPAHVALVIDPTEGFLLDRSLLDEDPL